MFEFGYKINYTETFSCSFRMISLN